MPIRSVDRRRTTPSIPVTDAFLRPLAIGAAKCISDMSEEEFFSLTTDQRKRLAEAMRKVPEYRRYQDWKCKMFLMPPASARPWSTPSRVHQNARRHPGRF